MKKEKKNFIDSLTMVFTYLSAVILVALVVLIVANILGRRLFNAPISGTVELVQYGMLVCITLAISRTGFEGRQLAVTLIFEALPKKVGAVLKCVCQIMAGVVFGSLIFNFISVLPSALSSGRVSDILHIPYYLVYYLLIVGMALVSLSFFYQAGLAVYRGFDGKKEGEI